ncbi:MAG: GIY-YIG nuclease family protein [Gemmatimonadales bacterium]|nr:GIY-YIG nuclease family protein [Gemmatimonadales bacterium]
MSPRRRRRRPVAPPKDVEMRIDNMLALVKDTARDVPGVYRMTSADGEVIYVGKSKQLRTRLLSYFRARFPRDKGARILREAATLEWEALPNEFAALLRELRLIKQLRPRYNVSMKRDARYHAFVRVSKGAAPRFHVVRGAGTDETGLYYGPFRGALQLEEALRELNDVLGLRDCRLDQPMYYADQPDLLPLPTRTPGCIRHEIGKCLGPCIAAVREEEYLARFRAAREFLEGAHESPLLPLRAQMEASSDALDFERAAVMRDKIRRLEALREQFGRIRFALESLSFVYTVPGSSEEEGRSYIVRRGRVRDERPVPRTAAERRALDAAVHDILAPVERAPAVVPGHEVDEILLVAAWFRKHPQELERTRSLNAPARKSRTA